MAQGSSLVVSRAVGQPGEGNAERRAGASGGQRVDEIPLPPELWPVHPFEFGCIGLALLILLLVAG